LGNLHQSQPRAITTSGAPEEWIPKLVARGLETLPVTFEHAYAVRSLPLLHGDPFDRMLIAQALCEGLTIVTVDPVICDYRVSTIDAAT
jgi:PIN domain nuclease of toxin-antitoxin system